MDNALVVEQRSIDVIPDSERHGSVRSLFTVWFSANMQITTVVTGAVAGGLGLPLWWAIIGLVVGNLVGAIFMALHSAQGPKLGIPQMIQSRAQFGYYGAILPLLLVVLMYVGFFAASAVLGPGELVAYPHHPGHDHRLGHLHGARHLRLPADPRLRALDRPAQRAGLPLPDDPAVL